MIFQLIMVKLITSIMERDIRSFSDHHNMIIYGLVDQIPLHIETIT